MTHVPNPGLANQSGLRAFFRVAGPVVLAVALVLMVTAGIDFFSTLDSFEGPTRFWMFFVGIPLLGVGSWLTQAGYAGAASRYASGELSPVIKDSAAYLSDGRGVAGVGRTVEDRAGAQAATGPYCRSCGARHDADARFCDRCGTSVA